MRDIALQILTRCQSDFILPETAFVFLVHQGYQFLFFETDKGENPPVFLVTDAAPHPKQLFGCFTEFLSQFVSDLEKLAAKNAGEFQPS